jgi:hypothetical protein
VISSRICLGSLRLCREGHPFFHSLDRDLWSRSNRPEFYAFSYGGPAARQLERTLHEARALQALPCEGDLATKSSLGSSRYKSSLWSPGLTLPSMVHSAWMIRVAYVGLVLGLVL